MEKRVIIYGIGKFAEYVSYVFQQDSEYKVVGFCIDESLYKSDSLYGLPLIKFQDLPSNFPPNKCEIFIAVGNNKIRTQFFKKFKNLNYHLANYISSKSSNWENLLIGENCFIDEGCVIQPFVEIEDNCILFTTDIGHHTKIEKNSLLSGAKTGGNVIIGHNCYIGLNASIKQNIYIGHNSVIGMGCSIERNTEAYEVFTNKGTIKRKITSDQIGNKFLQ